MRAAKAGNLRRWCLCGLIVGVVAVSGCTRRFYRERADREVNQILAEKDRYPFWQIEHFHVHPDPRARFADPTNPDRPPMPPDDPAAHHLSPNPQKPGKAGVARVEGDGYIRLLEFWDGMNRDLEEQKKEPAQVLPMPLKVAPPKDDTPDPFPPPKKDLSATPGTPEHPFRVNLDQCVELGLINSRDFQTRREDLYLTALPVTLQRFAFAAQFFATEEAIRERAGRLVPGGPRNDWALNTTGGFTKLFSTGALLMLRFANQTVIDFTGLRRHTVSETNLNLDLVQPLLRGGGKAVTLEPLTQAERNLLYAVRDYARFRKTFFVGLATGGDLNTFNPTPVRQGYLPTLLRAAQLVIDQKNVDNLVLIVKLIEAFKEGGVVTPLQVDQAVSQLLSAKSAVITDVQDFQGSLDNFKIQLGVPVNVALDLEDTPIRPIGEHLDRIERIEAQYDETIAEANKRDAAEEALKLRAHLRKLFTDAAIVEGTAFQKETLGWWKAWEARTDKEAKQTASELNAQRRKLLDLKADLETAGKPFPDDQQRRLEDLERELNFWGLEESLRAYEQQPWLKEAQPVRRQARQASMFREVINAFSLVLNEARKERIARWRSQWPQIPPVEVAGLNILEGEPNPAYETAAQTALNYRLDLMNQRARVTDTWRQLAVTANALLGVFNVEYHLSAFSPRGLAQPLLLDGSRVEHQLALNAQLPLVRKAERNNYRAALINYQRERRDLLEAEDRIVSTIRAEIRQLRVLAANYKIQQRVVELAYSNLESAREAFQAPPGGGAPGAPPAAPTQSSAAQAASLTGQLLSSQSALRGSQNGLLTLWINYLNTRMQLYRDLELMPLDFRGVWTDELATRESRPTDAAPVADGQWPVGGAIGVNRGPAGELVPARLLAPRPSAPPPG